MKSKITPQKKTNYSLKKQTKLQKKDSDLDIDKIQPLKSFQNLILKDLKQKFRKQIENPIATLTSIFNSKTPQRCLHHNNVLTLYCINDKQTLCVTCMYQNNNHKKHKVIPLNRASEQISFQLKSFINSIDSNLKQIDSMLKKSYSNIDRSQKQFPKIIVKVNYFYKQLQKLIQQKRITQIKDIQNSWAKAKYQHTAVARQLQNIQYYIVQQIKHIKSRSNEESLLFNRNIANQLKKITDFLPTQLTNYEQPKYLQQLKQFNSIISTINNKLIFTSSCIQTIQRKRPTLSKKSEKNNSLSPNKQNKIQIIKNKSISQQKIKSQSKSKSKTRIQNNKITK